MHDAESSFGDGRGHSYSARQKAALKKIVKQDVDVAMDEADSLGLDAFLGKYGFSKSQKWLVQRGDVQYPTKPIAARAIARFFDDAVPNAADFMQGYGEAESRDALERVGYAIVGTDQRQDTVDWDKVGDSWNWLARNSPRGQVNRAVLYRLKPERKAGKWFCSEESGGWRDVRDTDNYRMGTVDWSESLVQRPDRSAASPPARNLLSRDVVESAMDAYDQFCTNETHSEIFGAFGDPRDYWVRSTRERENRVYPSKPLIGFILKKTEFNGGWTSGAAAARLHNAGFIIVDQNGQPLEPPEHYKHLIGEADRIRLCALNYFIDPAREKAVREVSIRAGDIAAAMGLKDTFPNICQALGGEKFQNLAQVPPPRSTEPNPSSSTVFTYFLNSEPEADTVPATNNASAPSAVNLILYGPPGTGKTYRTAWKRSGYAWVMKLLVS